VPSERNVVRRRPKDRKAQIARSAAEAFSAYGYHAVSMEAIASTVGISAPALYRHYAGKYDLFRGAVLSLGQQLVDATEVATGDPGEALDQMIAALVEAAIANRQSGGLYRWEARYLRGQDQAALMDQLRTANRRIHRALTGIRPGLNSAERWMLSSALLSVIGSIMDHRAKLPANQIRSLLAELAWRMARADLPVPERAAPRAGRVLLFSADAGTYEALLHAAMVSFAGLGYRETSMEQIASAVGVPTSAIYRYFTGKSEILATAMRRAADRVSSELASAVSGAAAPADVLTRLITAYVTLSFDNPELACVYYAERVNLAPADQVMLRNVQRATVESWTRLQVAARPQWTSPQARFLVHAAMALVVDLGRLVRYHDSVRSQACVRTLMELALLGANQP
jgi:AcrR family transcriptional regulator